MSQEPIVAYLDSSDFSRLSDPRVRTEDLDRIRESLLDLARSGAVVFAFSGVHLSEMAPLDAAFTPAATARTDLLVQLCQRNALISLDRLLNSELVRLVDSSVPPVAVLSPDATWFPDMKDLVSPVGRADILSRVRSSLREQGLNYKQRRLANRKLARKGDWRSGAFEMATTGADSRDLEEILRDYPMRPEDGRVLQRYVLGRATKQAAEDAFLNSLRDPSWMMRWFACHSDKLTPVTQWLRAPGEDVAARFKQIAIDARTQFAALRTDASEARITARLTRAWDAAQDRAVLTALNAMLANDYPDAPTCSDASLVDERCPGLSVAIRALHSSFRDSILPRNPRAPRDSDFGDIAHALYAPYVTVFRADSYMAPHIQQQAARFGTVVVPHLEDLQARLAELPGRRGV